MTVNQAETTKTFQGYVSQTEANYIPLSPNMPAKACANCRWFMNDGCFIVEGYPEPVISTGYSDRWEAMPERPQDATEQIVEALVEVAEAMPTLSVEMSTDKPKRRSFVERIKDLFPKKQIDESFSVFKGVDGEWHWHAVFTNNFEDREGEILTEKAHDNYIGRLDMGLVPMPVLMAWHTPGTEHGEADVIWRDAHLVHAVGHFDDTPIAQKAIKFYQKNVGKIKMSHGFTAPEWAFDGTHYDDYNTIEITTLPPHAAANPYTSFEELLTMQKERSEEKSRYLTEVVGKENLAIIDSKSGEVNKALEELQLQYKDHSTVVIAPLSDAVTTEATKAVSELITDNITMLSEVIRLTQVQAKSLIDKDAQIAALKTEKDTQVSQLQADIEQLKTIVNAPPGRASQSMSTFVSKEDAPADALPKQPDTFYGDLFSPSPSTNGAKR